MERTLRWERWSTQVKLMILDKEGIILDILFSPKPGYVHLPPKQNYELPNDNLTEATEREQKTRNAQLELFCQMKCKIAMEAGILCCV